jgi:twitching motility protein PilT
MLDINSIFDFAISKNASDIHLISGYFPSIRVNGNLIQVRTSNLLDAQATKNLIESILTPEQKNNLMVNKEIDFGYEYKNYRLKTNIYHSRNTLAASFRLINKDIKNIEGLNLPSTLHAFKNYHQGLVLLTGPTGQGKSTTLAAIINEINMSFSKHIITIEDPMEFVYPPGRSIITQKEVYQDSLSWSKALRSILREDPDVILIGEMRDLETIQTVLTIAETGHLVFSTLHTISSIDTINRIIDVFPSHQQNQVRVQLATVLRAIICQRLIPTIDGQSTVPVTEILLNIPSVAANIRENKTHMIDNILETAEDQGLRIFEKNLVEMYKKGIISKDTALNHAIRPDEFLKFLSKE